MHLLRICVQVHRCYAFIWELRLIATKFDLTFARVQGTKSEEKGAASELFKVPVTLFVFLQFGNNSPIVKFSKMHHREFYACIFLVIWISPLLLVLRTFKWSFIDLLSVLCCLFHFYTFVLPSDSLRGLKLVDGLSRRFFFLPRGSSDALYRESRPFMSRWLKPHGIGLRWLKF